MIRKRASLILFFVLLAVTSFIMLMPSPPDMGSSIKGFDKFEHFAVFLVLSGLLCYSLGTAKSVRVRALIITFLSLAAYGMLIEFLQSFAGRSPELYDLIADFSGIAAGGLFALFFL